MWLELISIIVVGAIAYKFLSPRSKNIFKQHGIREIDTSVAVSKFAVFLGQKGMAEADDYAYKAMGSDKYCGISEMGNQLILIKDVELIKKILIKDFDYFVDRRDIFKEAEPVVRKMLPTLKGNEWRGIRTAISPTFTTGKIRRMMEYFNSVGKEWIDNFKEKAKASPDGSATIEALPSVNYFTIDVIASAVFGLSAGTIKNPKSMFARMATKLTEPSKWQLIKFAISLQFPKFAAKVLRLKIIQEDALDFFVGILDAGLKARMSGGDSTKRNDFLQLLVEAKKGELKAEGKDDLNSFEKDAQLETGGEKKQWLTEEIMNSQSLVFFLAGFSTTSNAISFALYAMACHQDFQQKLRDEVDSMLFQGGNDKEIDYDTLNELVYLDMVVCEVLRKFPAVARLERICVRDYKDSESGVFIPKGTIVAIPAYSIHHSPQYYDNPERFDPEHFNPDKKSKRTPYAFMPFGSGPRNCIGMRFALIEAKAAIAHLVHNFKVEPTNKTPVQPMQGKWVGFGMVPPKGMELKLTPLK